MYLHIHTYVSIYTYLSIPIYLSIYLSIYLCILLHMCHVHVCVCVIPRCHIDVYIMICMPLTLTGTLFDIIVAPLGSRSSTRTENAARIFNQTRVPQISSILTTPCFLELVRHNCKLLSTIIWEFPEIGMIWGYPNHPFYSGNSHSQPSSYWGIPIYGNPYMISCQHMIIQHG